MRLISHYHSRGGFWLRLGTFGPGIVVIDHRVHRPLFSERNGLRRVLHVGPWCVRWLPSFA